MKKETEVKQLHEKCDILDYVAYLESFFKNKEDLIKALKDKLCVSERN